MARKFTAGSHPKATRSKRQPPQFTVDETKTEILGPSGGGLVGRPREDWRNNKIQRAAGNQSSRHGAEGKILKVPYKT